MKERMRMRKGGESGVERTVVGNNKRQNERENGMENGGERIDINYGFDTVA